MLGKRPEGIVDVCKSKVSVVACYLDPQQDMVNSATANDDNNNIDIFSLVKREIYEETGIIEEKHIVDLICMGLIDNKEKNQINVPFCCKLNIPAKVGNASENELSDIIVPSLCIYDETITCLLYF
jgi:ABC-type Fe3+-citrate transport system substrate-binding protein